MDDPSHAPPPRSGRIARRPPDKDHLVSGWDRPGGM